MELREKVISASRRTDLPGFYWRWFMNRLDAGFCDVASPFDAGRVRRVSLAPRDVAAFVFWTRCARPMLPSVDQLREAGFAFYVHYTITGYPRELEPGVPSREESVNGLLSLSEKVGPHRVIWRYDPIVLSTATPAAYHEREFASLARELRGAVDVAYISFCDFYAKTRRAFARVAKETGWTFEAGTREEQAALAGRLADLARAEGMEVRACAETGLDAAGVRPGSCVDPALLARLRPDLDLRLRSAPSRSGCGCVDSVDVGAYDSCSYGCVYCDANRSPGVVRRRQASHDSTAPIMIG